MSVGFVRIEHALFNANVVMTVTLCIKEAQLICQSENRDLRLYGYCHRQ